MSQPSPAQIGALYDQTTDLFRKLSHSPFINLGFWDKRTHAIATAQRRMVLEFGRFCGLSRTFGIVDVGCGTGAQDLLWMKAFAPAWIRGINISGRQVAIARECARRSPYAARLSYDVGDACRMPHSLGKPDRVVGLECAYLFADIPSFFHAARQGLAPRGSLCLANITTIDDRAFAPVILNRLASTFPHVDFAPYRDIIATLPEQERKRALHLDDMLRVATKAGFSVGTIKDVSSHVAPCSRAFIQRTQVLLTECTGTNETWALILFAILLVLRQQQFGNGSLRYLFIELKK